MANLMIDPDKGAASITVIDFDDCGWSWYLFDLAAVVSFIEDTPEAERMISDWLRGYLEVRERLRRAPGDDPDAGDAAPTDVDRLGCVARRRGRRDRLHGRLRDGNCPAGRAVSHRPRLAARRHPLVVIFVDKRMSPYEALQAGQALPLRSAPTRFSLRLRRDCSSATSPSRVSTVQDRVHGSVHRCDPPFYGQVERDGERLNLRRVGEPVFVDGIRERAAL